MEKERSTIYVYLVNEGTDVWRPVSAEQLRWDPRESLHRTAGGSTHR
jgi:hypothetical protein